MCVDFRICGRVYFQVQWHCTNGMAHKIIKLHAPRSRIILVCSSNDGLAGGWRIIFFDGVRRLFI